MIKKLLGLSMLTVTCLYGILVGFILLISIFIGVELHIVLFVSIIVLLLQFLLAPFFTDLTMKWLYKAKFNYQMPEYLTNFINQICTQNNMKYPKIGYIDDGAPNAFTYGRGKNDARIVLTRGIFDLLNEEEVKSVVGHELGHIVHYDMAFMTMLQLVPLVLYYIYEIFTADTDDDKAKLALVGYIAYVLYVISQYIILWLSRTREYYADSFAFENTKNPNALAQALVKIGYGLTAPTTKEGKMSASKQNSLGIFDSKASKSLVVSSYSDGQVSIESIKNAMKWEMWNKWAKWYELNSTHPLISKRLLAISKRSPEFNQQPFITFDLKQPESYTDDFIRELLVLISPWLVLILWVILFVCGLPSFIHGLCLALVTICLFIKLGFTHKNKDYKETKVVNLLSEVKVSGVTAIPCVLEGTVIGRGDPGYIFNEDFIIKDDTGIVFIDYKHVLGITSAFVGLLKTKKLFGKKVRVKGWYRRSPVPYVEVLELQVENEKVKKMHTYGVTKVMYVIMLCISIILMFI